MKQGILKKWCSYITEIHIESMSSDYNEDLQVLLNKGRYQLCTPNAIYSYADKYDNFRDSFTQLNLDHPPIENVLLLGFGMGSIPYILEKKLHKDYAFTGVEIDEAVIYLASKYVLDDLKSEIELIQADAYSYISQCVVKYDLICIDIFVDDRIPSVFMTRDFLEDVNECLSKNGFIMFNHLAYTDVDKRLAAKYFKEVFSRFYSNGTTLHLKSNQMMISDKSRLLKN